MSAGETSFENWSLLDLSRRAGSEHLFDQYGVPNDAICKTEVLSLYARASLVIFALHGEEADIQENSQFLNYLATTPFGVSLSFQAETARQSPSKWRRFSQSTRLPGFVFAGMLYARNQRLDEEATPEELILGISKRSERIDPGTLEEIVAEEAKRNLPTPGTEQWEQFLREAKKSDEARGRREKRNRSKRSPNRYQETVRGDFLANALWSRRTSHIVSEYFPESSGNEHEKHEKEFNKAFSILKLTKARRPNILECPDTEG